MAKSRRPDSLDNPAQQRIRQKHLPPSPPLEHPHDEVVVIPSTSGLPSARLLSMPPPIRFLVCSIGNPSPYINTLHSAGHTVLSSLAASLFYPSFQKLREYGNGRVSAGSDFTLWQSPSLMNISGVSVAAAWRQFVKESRGEEAALIIVHDELELPLGQVKVKDGGLSAKGHNGLKSIKEVLRNVPYTRIGIGIGRPVSRNPDDVAKYVLRKMSPEERAKIEGCVGKVEEELRRLKG